MNDVFIETLIALTSVIVCWILYRGLIKYHVLNHPGSKLIITGFCLLLLSFTIDITDNFPQLNQYILIGETPYQAFIEKVVGSLFGLICLGVGFRRWLPSILEASIAKKSLKTLNNKLEQLVDERTSQLSTVNNQLLIEIKEREKTQQELNNHIYNDVLTKLPNRYSLLEYLEHEKHRNANSDSNHAIFLIDINNFKSVNDSLGHAFGDKVLVAIAKRLAFNHRSEDFLGRFGGDEFMLVLPDLKGTIPDVALQTYNNAANLLEILSAPLKVDEHHLNLTVSIGITVFNYNKMGLAEDILRQADIALYHAKDKGHSVFSFYQPEMQKKAQNRLGKSAELHQAIHNKELFLHYQPQVDNAGKIMGLEALLRWQHPTRGIVDPGEFIALAEEIGVIDKLGRYILHLACQECAQIVGTAYPDSKLKIAINISPSHFFQDDFVNQISVILASYDLSNIRIVLEITEEETIVDIEDVTEKMILLSRQNVSFSLDDFGTGYSSLTYLKRLPIETVKIDRSFINDVVTNPDDASIVTAILTMTNALRIDVIAEGIENKEQHEFLKNNNCQYYQGYFFGKPQSISALTESGLLTKRSR